MLTISPQIPKFYIAFSLETHCCRRHTCTCATKLLHHLGTGCCLPKTTFRTKIGGGGAWLKKHPKMWDPLRISATVEASIFKFGTQLSIIFKSNLEHPRHFYGWSISLPRDKAVRKNYTLLTNATYYRFCRGTQQNDTKISTITTYNPTPRACSFLQVVSFVTEPDRK